MENHSLDFLDEFEEDEIDRLVSFTLLILGFFLAVLLSSISSTFVISRTIDFKYFVLYVYPQATIFDLSNNILRNA